MEKRREKNEEAMRCYAVMVFIAHISANRISKNNRRFKRWLAGECFLPEKKKIGKKAAKRIFWLHSVVNRFIGREKRKTVITEGGYKFIRESVFFRFKTALESSSHSLKRPRYIGYNKGDARERSLPAVKMFRKVEIPIGIIEHKGNGYKAIKYSLLPKKSNQAGFITEILKLSLESGCASVSFATVDAWMKGERHDNSKTQEIFIFHGGNGYMEIGDDKVLVKDGYLVIVDAGVSHRLIPEIVPCEGQFLKGLVVSFPGFDGPADYVIGKSKAQNDEPPV